MRIPPIACLRALEAAARHGSYTKAAQELNVTQSAVSHQIHHAEDIWGLKLFEKRGRRLVLSANGQALVPLVRDFFERLSDTIDDLKDEEVRSSLRVSLLRSFAFKWLVPRLGRFNERYPDIEIWLSTAEELVDFEQRQADVAIRLGRGDWPRVYKTLLLREHVFPVCSPRFLQQIKAPSTPAELLNYPLLRRFTLDITPRWNDWFKAAQVKVAKMPRASKFADTSMAIQAAIDDQGIALARSAHVADDLAAGRLLKLFDISLQSDIAYYFVCPLGDEEKPAVKVFKDWLVEQCRIAQKEFDAVVTMDP